MPQKLFLMYWVNVKGVKGEFFPSVKVTGKKFTEWIGLTFFLLKGRTDARLSLTELMASYTIKYV